MNDFHFLNNLPRVFLKNKYVLLLHSEKKKERAISTLEKLIFVKLVTNICN